MHSQAPLSWTAFANRRRIAHGDPKVVVSAVKARADAEPTASIAVFDAHTSMPIELDLRGSLAAVLRRLPVVQASALAPAPAPSADGAREPTAPRGPGRPRLGVVAREVTLLPRHWDWLGGQTGGASVALRKLVEHAQRSSAETDRLRAALESAYRFMHAMAGDAAGFEEASRALFAHDLERLQRETARWPRDVRLHLLELAGRSVAAPGAGAPALPR